MSDGTRVNTSSKLSETKKIDELEITDIQVTEKGNVCKLLGTIKNTTGEKKGGYNATIKFVDESGKEITSLPYFLPTVEANSEQSLCLTATFDYANAYDFTITK